ncbi:MAG: hypothetical protein KDA63_00805 [Planctomycetales bacterium]|nr:hypothetical protein [Planctomycetales bacterium]
MRHLRTWELLGEIWTMESATGEFLSFYTPDSEKSSEWSAKGDRLRLALANELEASGLEIDLETKPFESDWLFYASHEGERFAVVMAIVNFGPSGWWVGLEGPTSDTRPSRRVRDAVTPLILSAVERFPETYDLRWHADWTTLREIKLPEEPTQKARLRRIVRKLAWRAGFR